MEALNIMEEFEGMDVEQIILIGFDRARLEYRVIRNLNLLSPRLVRCIE